MTDLEIVQEARELIESRIKSKKLDLKELDEMQSALGLTNLSFETSRITYTADLNILLAHKAFFERHYQKDCGQECLCDYGCAVDGETYPCPESVAQAKAIMGVDGERSL